MQIKRIILPMLIFLWVIPVDLKAQTVQDINGNIYPAITNGSLLGMAENLKTTRYNDGTSIPLIENRSTWETLTQPAYCWLFNKKSRNREIGALYNWYAVETDKLCPIGWHVPSDKVFLVEAPWPGGSRDYVECRPDPAAAGEAILFAKLRFFLIPNNHNFIL